MTEYVDMTSEREDMKSKVTTNKPLYKSTLFLEKKNPAVKKSVITSSLISKMPNKDLVIRAPRFISGSETPPSPVKDITIRSIQQEKVSTDSTEENTQVARETLSLPPFYSVIPELDTLNSLSPEQIRRVDGLRVSNAHGIVLFRDPVDLSDYSLHLDLTISSSVVDIYPEGRERPEKGTKLNQRALITMFRCPLWFDQLGLPK